MVQCACELLGINVEVAPSVLQLSLSVAEFENELRNRFGAAHPDLVFRTDSTLERARLYRREMPGVPKVILRQGAPRRDDTAAEQPNTILDLLNAPAAVLAAAGNEYSAES
jgi:hypothetical protein